MTEKERAEAHWNGYVEPMMRVMMNAAIEMSKFHYISSHIHGAKHAVEDMKTAPLPGSARYEEIHAELTEGEVAELGSICIDCRDQQTCRMDVPKNTQCGWFRGHTCPA